jgi:membrane protein DedA with SNARE-associated domain
LEKFVAFVQTWGYLAVFLGALVEGESVILTASSMASFGYLSLPKVMVVAFTGTLIADQALYMLGRFKGPSFFDRFPKLQGPSQRAFSLLNKYDVWFIIACRFIYGIRVTSAIVIGASGVPPRRFIPLNILSAFIWTVVSCVGGYLLGDLMMELFHNFDRIQKYILEGIFFLIVIMGAFFYYKRLKKKAAEKV